jgi:hypothetical protein
MVWTGTSGYGLDHKRNSLELNRGTRRLELDQQTFNLQVTVPCMTDRGTLLIATLIMHGLIFDL